MLNATAKKQVWGMRKAEECDFPQDKDHGQSGIRVKA